MTTATGWQPPFTTLATCNGYEIIDVKTGRTVAPERETLQSASGVAYILNVAAAKGPKFLARALRTA